MEGYFSDRHKGLYQGGDSGAWKGRDEMEAYWEAGFSAQLWEYNGKGEMQTGAKTCSPPVFLLVSHPHKMYYPPRSY